MVQETEEKHAGVSWLVQVTTGTGVVYSSVFTLADLRAYKQKHPEVKYEDAPGVIPKYVLPIALHKNKALDIKKLLIKRKNYEERYT